MPNLSLANNISSKSDRQRLEILSATFSAGTEGFSGEDASLLGGGSSKRLRVQASASNGYAWRSFTVTPGVTYEFWYKWFQSGNPSIQSAGIIHVGTPSTPDAYIDGSISSSNVTYTLPKVLIVPTESDLKIKLITVTNGRNTYWDNIYLNEWDGVPV